MRIAGLVLIVTGFLVGIWGFYKIESARLPAMRFMWLVVCGALVVGLGLALKTFADRQG